MEALFIADLHLCPERPEAIAGFLRFLEQQTSHCEHLYILGDLFEVWIGDDDDAPWLRDCLTALAAVEARGIPVTVLRGNRDFLLGAGFERSTGARLLEDGSVIDLHGRRTLLMHGDVLCTRDVEYQRFRRSVRDPEWQRSLLATPLEERRRIAGELRRQSREAGANKPENIMDVTPEAVTQSMAEAGVELLIHGHTHRPGSHPVDLPGGAGQRWVLGDWQRRAWWLRVGPAGPPRLESHPL